MNNLTIQQFLVSKEIEELESDAYSQFFLMQNTILEKIFVSDQREVIFLLNSFENITKHRLPNIVNYIQIEYVEKEKCIQILRPFYQTTLLQYKQRNKQEILSIVQQLFQTLATLEGFGIHLLGLKPSNIFIENGHLYLNGFIRTEKFLLSQPMYQSKDLRMFIQECISTNKYNINQRYQNKSHSMIYSALAIIVQFLLNEEFEYIANLIRWLDNQDDNLKSVPTTEILLNKIENQFDGMRLFIEQAKCLLTNEYYNKTNDLAIQLMLLASELKLTNGILHFGSFYQIKQNQPEQNNNEIQQIEKQQQINNKPIQQSINTQKKQTKNISKRCGGGFALKQKK